MKRGIFVAGTGTSVGKTVLSAALMHRYRPVLPVRYWKPVQTGYPADDDTATVRFLGSCTPDEICVEGIRLPRPLSPHLAAELAGTHIELNSIVGAAGNQCFVEGAGGVLVPLDHTYLMIDLIAALELPVVVMAHSGLGTINHTLLTLEALRDRSIPVAGVVLGGDPNPPNRKAIEQFGRVLVVGEMPAFHGLSPSTLKAWAEAHLDPDSCLQRFLEGATT